jgi:acetyl esterase/lipase
MRLSFALSVLLSLSGCAVKRTANVVYQAAGSGLAAQELDVYAPRNRDSACPVLIFIHGGNWNSGKKSTYWLLGRNFARKGIVTVIINYPLSPAATYDAMARASAQAVQWTQQNIGTYGGDPSRLFVSGHSAGGHLAALIALDDSYFAALSLKDPLAGVILIDAAGLDMYNYLLEKKYDNDNTYIKTFTNDPATWRKASPRYYLDKSLPPMLIYRGEETYDSIEKSTEAFMKDYRTWVADPHYEVLDGKKHIPMITQFFFPWNSLYPELIDFMESAGKDFPKTTETPPVSSAQASGPVIKN